MLGRQNLLHVLKIEHTFPQVLSSMTYHFTMHCHPYIVNMQDVSTLNLARGKTLHDVQTLKKQCSMKHATEGLQSIHFHTAMKLFQKCK